MVKAIYQLLFGSAITLYVAWTAGQIRKSIRVKQARPKVLERLLVASTKTIEIAGQGVPLPNDTHKLMIEIKSCFYEAQAVVPWHVKWQIWQHIRFVTSCGSKPSHEQLFRIGSALVEVRDKIKSRVEESEL